MDSTQIAKRIMRALYDWERSGSGAMPDAQGLAQQLNVDLHDILDAFDILESDGYLKVYRVEGEGRSNRAQITGTGKKVVLQEADGRRSEAKTTQPTADVTNQPTPIRGRKVFVVHGHDEQAKEATARFLEKLGLQPIILHEQPNQGKTIIEKFEAYSDVGYAVVLLTPDDIGAPRYQPDQLKPRARQNVILELGFYLGKLRRSNVCALYKGDVEIPSDYQGVLYLPMDEGGAWQLRLAKEIKAAGIEVDLNKLA